MIGLECFTFEKGGRDGPLGVWFILFVGNYYALLKIDRRKNAISFFVYRGLVSVVLVVEIDRTEATDSKTCVGEIWIFSWQTQWLVDLLGLLQLSIRS